MEINNFESFHSFEYYFPRFNVDKAVEKLNNLNEKREKEKNIIEHVLLKREKRM